LFSQESRFILLSHHWRRSKRDIFAISETLNFVFGQFHLPAEIPKIAIFEALKFNFDAFFAILDRWNCPKTKLILKIVSHKIWEAEKIWNFHIVDDGKLVKLGCCRKKGKKIVFQKIRQIGCYRKKERKKFIATLISRNLFVEKLYESNFLLVLHCVTVF